MKSYQIFLESINRSEITIEHILNEKDKEAAIQIPTADFARFGTPASIYSYIKHSVDFDISLIAKYNDEVIGSLLFTQTNLTNHPIYISGGIENINENVIEQIKDKRGLEGFALSVKPEYRNSFAVYKLLYEMTQMIGYDYVWLLQYESLQQNIKYDNKMEYVGYFEEEEKVNIYVRMLK